MADCWSNHDYISIGPSALGDMVAQVAVRGHNCERLFARTASTVRDNLTVLREWLDSFEGFFECVEPRAGAFVFVKYDHDIPSVELVERLRENQSVLVVPGAHFGMEGYLRISLGVPREALEAGLALIERELGSLRPSPRASPLQR